jgi:hypothetical protein
MQPYPCATTTVTPAGRTALCPLPSILGAIGHLDKTKDLSSFPAGEDEPRSASRPNPGSRAEGSPSAGKANFSDPRRTLPRIPRISRTISVGPAHLTTHTTHITHHFRRPRRTLPRIPRISRTISVGRDAPYHAYHASHAPFPSASSKPLRFVFPNSSWRTTQVFLESPTLMLCIRRPQRSGLYSP